MSSLLLSDLHLPAQPSPLRETFVAFLEGPARSAQRVLILGDLFEYWIGDDVGLQIYAREVSRLAALTASGVEVALMHGNRDFLVGQTFCDITGVRLLRDPTVMDLEGTPTLLTHGDLFCTDDIGYQRWRRVAHNRVARALFRALPRAWREGIAGGLRGQSASGKARKPAAIMDVNASAVTSTFARHGINRIIHGHTHRPADHACGDGRQRIVLADWTATHMEYLQIDAAGMQRISLR